MGGGDEWEVGESSGRKAQLDKGGVRPGELTWAELLISFGERGSNCSSVTDLVMTLMKQGCEREPTEKAEGMAGMKTEVRSLSHSPSCADMTSGP